MASPDHQQVLNANMGQNLTGLPSKPVMVPNVGRYQFGSHGEIQNIANQYNQQRGLGEHPTDYSPVDPSIAAKIADEYEKMEHNPDDPKVQAAYQALKDEAMDQYKAIVDAGYTFDFYPEEDPYPNSPREAVLDVHNNKHMYVFPTVGEDGGFGQDAEEHPNHPMLEFVPGLQWSGKPVTYNDVFRAIHDIYGHVKEGLGFRAEGEDNAYRQHNAMFSPLAQQALATETRGQNSWVNYGPHGEHNQTATTDTIYAPQKAGLLPQWVSNPDIHVQQRQSSIHQSEDYYAELRSWIDGLSAVTTFIDDSGTTFRVGKEPDNNTFGYLIDKDANPYNKINYANLRDMIKSGEWKQIPNNITSPPADDPDLAWGDLRHHIPESNQPAFKQLQEAWPSMNKPYYLGSVTTPQVGDTVQSTRDDSTFGETGKVVDVRSIEHWPHQEWLVKWDDGGENWSSTVNVVAPDYIPSETWKALPDTPEQQESLVRNASTDMMIPEVGKSYMVRMPTGEHHVTVVKGDPENGYLLSVAGNQKYPEPREMRWTLRIWQQEAKYDQIRPAPTSDTMPDEWTDTPEQIEGLVMNANVSDTPFQVGDKVVPAEHSRFDPYYYGREGTVIEISMPHNKELGPYALVQFEPTERVPWVAKVRVPVKELKPALSDNPPFDSEGWKSVQDTPEQMESLVRNAANGPELYAHKDFWVAARYVDEPNFSVLRPQPGFDTEQEAYDWIAAYPFNSNVEIAVVPKKNIAASNNVYVPKTLAPSKPPMMRDQWERVQDTPEEIEGLVRHAAWVPAVGDKVMLRPDLAQNSKMNLKPETVENWTNYPEGEIIEIWPASHRPDGTMGWPLFKVRGEHMDGLLLRREDMIPLETTQDDQETPAVPDTLPDHWSKRIARGASVDPNRDWEPDIHPDNQVSNFPSVMTEDGKIDPSKLQPTPPSDYIDRQQVEVNAYNNIPTWTNPKTNEELPWWDTRVPKEVQNEAILNAFKVAILSPQKHLKWNAAHYQAIADMPPHTEAYKLYERLSKERELHNQALGFEPESHLSYSKEVKELVKKIQKHEGLSEADAQVEARRAVHDMRSDAEQTVLYTANKHNIELDPLTLERKVHALVDRWLKGGLPTHPVRKKKGPRGGEKKIKLAPEDISNPIDRMIKHPEVFPQRPDYSIKSPKPKAEKFDHPQLFSKTAVDDWTAEQGSLEHGFDEPYTLPDESVYEGNPPIGDANPRSKYGMFYTMHLNSIAELGQHVDELRKAALQDIREDQGRGYHFRNSVLNMDISGAGPKVTSFVWLLLNPMKSELGVLDTHMARVFGVHENDMQKPKAYYKFERQQKAAKDASGYKDMPLGLYHWGLWDLARSPNQLTGKPNASDHQALRPLNPLDWRKVKWDPSVVGTKDNPFIDPIGFAATRPLQAQVAAEYDKRFEGHPQGKAPEITLPPRSKAAGFTIRDNAGWQENPVQDVGNVQQRLQESDQAQKKEFSSEEAQQIAVDAGVDLNQYDPEQFRQGLAIEWEHAGTVHGDMNTVAHIVVDHLNEYPDYYARLRKVETHKTAEFDEGKHPRDNAGKFTAKSDIHELRVHDKEGKHTHTIKRCHECGVLHKDNDKCPTCGASHHKESSTKQGAFKDVFDAASSAGWEHAGTTKKGHNKFTYTDPSGGQHLVLTGTAGHAKRNRERSAQEAYGDMQRCMRGQCGHLSPQEAQGLQVEAEPAAPVIRAGQTVFYKNQPYMITELAGNIAAIYNTETGQNEVVDTSELKAAAWHPVISAQEEWHGEGYKTNELGAKYNDENHYKLVQMVMNSGIHPWKTSAYDPQKAEKKWMKIHDQLANSKWGSQQYDPRVPQVGDTIKTNSDVLSILYRDELRPFLNANEDWKKILDFYEEKAISNINVSINKGAIVKVQGETASLYQTVLQIGDIYVKPANSTLDRNRQEQLRISINDMGWMKIPKEAALQIELHFHAINQSTVLERKTSYEGEYADKTNLEVLDHIVSQIPPEAASIYSAIPEWLKKGTNVNQIIRVAGEAAPYLEWARMHGDKAIMGDLGLDLKNVQSAGIDTISEIAYGLRKLGLNPETNRIEWDTKPIFKAKDGSTISPLPPESDEYESEADWNRQGTYLNHCYAGGGEYQENYAGQVANRGDVEAYAVRDKTGRPLATFFLGKSGIDSEHPYGTHWTMLENRGKANRALDPNEQEREDSEIHRNSGLTSGYKAINEFLASAEKSGIEIDRMDENRHQAYHHPEFGHETEPNYEDWEYEHTEGESMDVSDWQDAIQVYNTFLRNPYAFENSSDWEPDHDSETFYAPRGLYLEIDKSNIDNIINEVVGDAIAADHWGNQEPSQQDLDEIQEIAKAIYALVYYGAQEMGDHAWFGYGYGRERQEQIAEQARQFLKQEIEHGKTLAQEELQSKQESNQIRQEVQQERAQMPQFQGLQSGDWVDIGEREIGGRVIRYDNEIGYITKINLDGTAEVTVFNRNNTNEPLSGITAPIAALKKSEWSPELFNTQQYYQPTMPKALDVFFNTLEYLNSLNGMPTMPDTDGGYTNINQFTETDAVKAIANQAQAQTPMKPDPAYQTDTDMMDVLQHFTHTEKTAGTTMFHVAPASARSSIQTSGLMSEKSMTMHTGIPRPEGVYAFDSLPSAMDWAGRMGEWTDFTDPMDIWRINASNMRIERDPYNIWGKSREPELQNAFVIKDAIPLNNIALVQTIQPDQLQELRADAPEEEWRPNAPGVDWARQRFDQGSYW